MRDVPATLSESFAQLSFVIADSVSIGRLYCSFKLRMTPVNQTCQLPAYSIPKLKFLKSSRGIKLKKNSWFVQMCN